MYSVLFVLRVTTLNLRDQWDFVFLIMLRLAQDISSFDADWKNCTADSGVDVWMDHNQCGLGQAVAYLTGGTANRFFGDFDHFLWRQFYLQMQRFQ